MTRRFFCRVLLVVAAIFGFLFFSGVLSAQGNSENAFERVREVQEKHTDWLMAIDGVEGTAIGFNPNARLSVTVLLERPGVGGLPQQLEGVAVHPVVTGKIYALPKPPGSPGKGPGGEDPPADEPVVDRSGWCSRPVPIGVSTGHTDITAGTIACRVSDLAGNIYVMSNNHVYANENLASVGDNVLQPGPYDGGGQVEDRDDVIGTLHDFEDILFYEPPFVTGDPVNIIDAAISTVTLADFDGNGTEELSVGNATPDDGYGTPKSATATAYLNQKVKKYGRSTGLTKGQVIAINATVDVGYDSGVARFVDQIIISPGTFSSGGDSGSLVVVDGKGRNKSQDRKPVGLLFAGSSTVTIANPIDAVLTRFGVSVDDSE